jgi:hypothetical protein
MELRTDRYSLRLAWAIDCLVPRGSTFRNASFAVNRSTAMNGASTAHTYRSRQDGSFASFSGRSVDSLQWRRPAIMRSSQL